MKWVFSSLLIILLFCVKCEPKVQEPTPTPTQISGECSEELIGLLELVLESEPNRELYIKRIRELDPSPRMTIAIELMDNVALQEILEQEKMKCQ